MHPDRCTVVIHDTDWVETAEEPVQPVLRIRCHARRPTVDDRLTGPDGDWLAAEELDVAFRLQSSPDAADVTGVVSVANRVTGALIVEASTPAAPIYRFVDAARRYGETTDSESWYTVRLVTARSQIPTYRKRIFLVYAQDGTLLRHRSIIPNGIEI